MKWLCCIMFVLIVSSAGELSAQSKKSFEYSADSNYGYTPTRPLKMKKGNPANSIENSIEFLKRLKTSDGQSLNLVSRTSVENPAYKKPVVEVANRFNNLETSASGRLLDKYTFVVSNSKDTIRLYVDIYNKKEVKIPLGLKYEAY